MGRRLPVVRDTAPVEAALPEPKLRGEALLRALEAPFLWLDRVLEPLIPRAWNPFAQTGAIANVMLIVAVATGALLLIWYSPSVYTAHASLEAMRGSVIAQLVRSLHRYSSDACMLFVLLHALRLFGARRFSGARWLAWITGLVLIGTLWLVGWLGYWLVWDEPARQIALGTSKLFDVIPIFTEPMTRSFLTDRSIQSLLFFIVFFVHMLLPLVMAIAIWLHITRLSRATFFTAWPMTVASIAALVVVSLAFPATSGAPARMLEPPGAMSVDAYYLLPIAITDRLGGGALWLVTLVGGLVLASLPWTLSRGRAQVAKVDLAKCNACNLCAVDCPYDAILMVPRTDGRRYELEARVDESKCVGCGICAGSCDSSAIAVPLVSQVEARARLDRWVDSGEDEHVAFVCARSAGASLDVDAASGHAAALPGYRVMPVPCVGWVHALTIERVVRHGARGVLLVGCGSTEPAFREGAKWTAARLSTQREPALRTERVDPKRVRLVQLGRGRSRELAHEAKRLREGIAERTGSGRIARAAVGLVVGAALLAAVVGISQATYVAPSAAGPELVVSFRHAGRSEDRCREVSPEEMEKLPPHMRRAQVCDRGRAPVRLRVEVDGVVVVERPYAASGLAGDGPSIAIETVPLAPGAHDVTIAIGESHDPSEWTYREHRPVTFEPRGRVVVLFDLATGFTWDGV